MTLELKFNTRSALTPLVLIQPPEALASGVERRFRYNTICDISTRYQATTKIEGDYKRLETTALLLLMFIIINIV
jgi:hypothetical protein